MSQFNQLLSIHFKEFFREPGIIFWAIFFPILMAWGLGIAFTQKQDLTRTVAVIGQGNGWFESPAASVNKNELIIGNDRIGRTVYRMVETTWDSSMLMLKRGQVTLILEHRNDSIIYHFDPLNPEAQLGYLQIFTALERPGTSVNGANVAPLTDVGTRYVDFLIPGLVAMGIMMSSMWGISYALIDKRMKKLLRRMVATPMSRPLFLITQIVARVALSALEACLLVLFADLYFGITIQGSYVALLLTFLAGNVAFSGLAVLVSSRTDNTRIGNGIINAVIMPMMIMSGVFFSYHNFPDWTIAIIKRLPLTMLADSTRSIFIQGAGLEQVFPAVLILTAFGMVCFSVGLRFYKWY